jgi:hypothetical protein
VVVEALARLHSGEPQQYGMLRLLAWHDPDRVSVTTDVVVARIFAAVAGQADGRGGHGVVYEVTPRGVLTRDASPDPAAWLCDSAEVRREHCRVAGEAEEECRAAAGAAYPGLTAGFVVRACSRPRRTRCAPGWRPS